MFHYASAIIHSTTASFIGSDSLDSIVLLSLIGSPWYRHPRNVRISTHGRLYLPQWVPLVSFLRLLSHDAISQHLSQTCLILKLLFQLRLRFCQFLLLTCHEAMPQLFSMITLCLPSQEHLGNCYKIQSLAVCKRYSLDMHRTKVSVCCLWRNTFQKFFSLIRLVSF